MGKIRVWGLRGSIVADNSENGECHELRTYILIDNSVLDKQIDLPENREVCMLMNFDVSWATNKCGGVR